MGGKYVTTDVVIDVVCDDGTRWIKVKAASAFAMQMQLLSCNGKAKNVVTLAESMLVAANQHPIAFMRPTVEMVFSQGVTSDLAYVLTNKGIRVRGRVVEQNFLMAAPKAAVVEQPVQTVEPFPEAHHELIGLDDTTVNLGVRTMLT